MNYYASTTGDEDYMGHNKTNINYALREEAIEK